MFYLMHEGKLVAASEIFQSNGSESSRFMTEDYVATLLTYQREHFNGPLYDDGCFREKSLEAHDMVRNSAAQVLTDNSSIFALYGQITTPKPDVIFVQRTVPLQTI